MQLCRFPGALRRGTDKGGMGAHIGGMRDRVGVVLPAGGTRRSGTTGQAQAGSVTEQSDGAIRAGLARRGAEHGGKQPP